ncbi:MAG TPA: CDP-glycerol glycerophosphotransferase family protein [Candidatus Paceibacterota bacterium]
MKSKTGKTIFIIIGRGSITRNILRSGVLAELKKTGHKIVLIFWNVRNQPLPDYLRAEFKDDNVILETVPGLKPAPLYRRFGRLTSLLVYNNQIREIRYLWGKRRLGWLFWERILFYPLSKLHFLKHLVRFFETFFFTSDIYADYFNRYQPDLVFSTSVIASVDMEFIKEAKRRGIKTVSMPRGWDNVNTIFYKVAPDLFLVQNEMMKRDAIAFQCLAAERIKVVGFPQFDWYYRSEILMSREDYCRRYGLDPTQKIVFWASTPDDTRASQVMLALFENNELEIPSSLLVRAHFKAGSGSNAMDSKKLPPRVVLDHNWQPASFFWDNYDLTADGLKLFTNTIYHADAVITLCSSIALDALNFNKPIINLAFGSWYDKDGNDISPKLYEYDVYRPMLTVGAVTLVYSKEELIKAIGDAFRHPENKSAERLRARDLFCYRGDGQSSCRVAEAVTSLL